MKHTIWQSEITQDDFVAAKDWIIERDNVEEETLTDEKILAEASELNAVWLDDERSNLDQKLNGYILCIAELGLWNGKRQGYKIIEKQNLNGIFNVNCCGKSHFYVEGADVKATDSHHDGTNIYTFRELRMNTNYDALLDALYNGTATSTMIRRYTKCLGHRVRKVYGWTTHRVSKR